MIGGRIRNAGAVFAFVLLLAGCGDSLFSSLDDPREVEVRLDASGSHVTPDGVVELELIYRSEQVESLTALTVQFRSTYEIDSIVETVELAPAALGTSGILSIPIPPEVGTGVYWLEVTGWRGSTEVFTESRQIFLADDLPVIRQLFLHPARPVVDSSMLAVAVLDVPDDQRPWLRWFLGGDLLAEGYLEEGFDQMILPAGASAGAYAVRLDVLPWGPEEGVQTISLGTAPASAQAGLLVQADFDPDELLRDGESLLWYPLQGHLRSAVRLLPALEMAELFPEGNPEAVISDEVFLQFLANTLGFFVPADATLDVAIPILPELERTQILELDLVVPSGQGGRILTLTTVDDAEFSLWIDQQGSVSADKPAVDTAIEDGAESAEEPPEEPPEESPEVIQTALSLVIQITPGNIVVWEAVSADLDTSSGELVMDSEFSRDTRLIFGGEQSASLLVGAIVLRWLASDADSGEEEEEEEEEEEVATDQDGSNHEDSLDGEVEGAVVPDDAAIDDAEAEANTDDETNSQIPDSSVDFHNENFDEN